MRYRLIADDGENSDPYSFMFEYKDIDEGRVELNIRTGSDLSKHSDLIKNATDHIAMLATLLYGLSAGGVMQRQAVIDESAAMLEFAVDALLPGMKSIRNKLRESIGKKIEESINKGLANG